MKITLKEIFFALCVGCLVGALIKIFLAPGLSWSWVFSPFWLPLMILTGVIFCIGVAGAYVAFRIVLVEAWNNWTGEAE